MYISLFLDSKYFWLEKYGGGNCPPPLPPVPTAMKHICILIIYTYMYLYLHGRKYEMAI